LQPYELFIGLRYIRAKRRNHFISFISLISMLGMALGVMALIVVLSVMNGFAPYTSIATNVLFFEKGAPTQDVWFFEHPYPAGYKSYSRGKPLTIAEFDLEKAWWGSAQRKGRKATEQAWKVSAKDIAARNYNLDCKNPHQVKINHRDPAELMQEYQKISHQLTAAQQALKDELIACSGAKA